ncbi:transcription factor E2F1-like [Ctenopharyngodon idella]|uniref:transcription factor E2F1-like n=1 Tax=Ctenopharyngodon idella TaxID=7959 RepID=UPI002230CBEA|nr:transcription factor E2F1-like [Ctenopharyngodon idella]
MFRLGYVTWQDLCKTVNPLDKIMVIRPDHQRTPPEMQVQVSESSEGCQISVKSSKVPLDMFLFLEDSSGVCSPVTDYSPAKSSCQSPPQSELVSQEVTSSSLATLCSSSPLPLSTDFESFLDLFSGIREMPDFDLSPLGSSDFLLECGGAADSNGLLLDGFPCLSPPHSQEYHFDLEF